MEVVASTPLKGPTSPFPMLTGSNQRKRPLAQQKTTNAVVVDTVAAAMAAAISDVSATAQVAADAAADGSLPRMVQSNWLAVQETEAINSDERRVSREHEVMFTSPGSSQGVLSPGSSQGVLSSPGSEEAGVLSPDSEVHSPSMHV